MEHLVSILEKYGAVTRNENEYELELKITANFLQIPEEYLEEFPICRNYWKIGITIVNSGFIIKTADPEANKLSEDEQKEVLAFLARATKESGANLDGFAVFKKGICEDAAFRESIGRIIGIVKEYCRLLGHQILEYTIYYSIDCFCGYELKYSKFNFKCENPCCGANFSLSKINECLDTLMNISDLDCTGVARKGEDAFFLSRTNTENFYKLVRITNSDRKKWINHFHKKVEILSLTNASLSYSDMEFHPLQRGNEDNVPIFLCWVDISGGAKLLRKHDIQKGYSILLKLDARKKTVQVFKPTSFLRGNALYLENYDLPIEMPRNVKARITFQERMVGK